MSFYVGAAKLVQSDGDGDFSEFGVGGSVRGDGGECTGNERDK